MHKIKARMSILETKMELIEDVIRRIDGRLISLQDGHIRILERFSLFQAHTDERFSLLQAHTDERISSLQAHTDERISVLQARTDERITGLHQAMVSQTRWILGAILGAAGLISVILPVVIKYLWF